MSRDSFGPFRCRLSRKPWLKRAKILFYRCAACNRIFHEYVPEHPVSDGQHTENDECGLQCCNQAMFPLSPKIAGDDLSYDIFGGFNHNAVKAAWKDQKPFWILLQTYTGAYLKYTSFSKRMHVIFPLAEEDAYVYCDRPVCEKCLYCCKKGCNLFFYFGGEDLRVLPLDQISDYFKH